MVIVVLVYCILTLWYNRDISSLHWWAAGQYCTPSYWLQFESTNWL